MRFNLAAIGGDNLADLAWISTNPVSFKFISLSDCQYVASSDAMGDGFYILQPGSTVATSLTKEEALPKHVFLIKASLFVSV